MKKFYLTVLSISLTIGAFSQSKINSEGLFLIDRYDEEIETLNNGILHSTVLSSDNIELSIPPVVSAIISLDKISSVELLESIGVEILRTRGNFAIVRFPIHLAEKIEELNEVKSISFGAKSKPLMDKARSATGIDELQSGVGFDQPFDGRGVIVGMMDGGLDPNHLAFTDADNNNRISRLWTISGENSSVIAYSTPSSIASFDTDDRTSSHATHVAGIMAGSYDRAGRCRIDQINAAGTETVATKSKIQFKGIATASDLAFVCGDLYDPNILLGIESIIDYAEEQGQPAVINLSLGGNTGAHDGTDDFEQYLADLGKDAIICIASGNEGADNVSLTKQFSANDNQIKTFLLKSSETPSEAIGIFEAWNIDNEPIDASFIVYDTNSSSIVYEKNISEISGQITILKSSDPVLGNAWVNGSNVKIRQSISPNNNRYRLYSEVIIGQNDPRYIPGFILKGTPGKTVECFVNDLGLYSNSVAGWDAGNGDNSANTMCTGDNIISVGAWTTKNKYYPSTGSGVYSTPNVVGELCSFSSHGRQLITGKEIPDVCAPGAAIVSAYSRYYVEDQLTSGHLGNVNDLCGRAPVNNPTDFWHAMQGTSMATPVVTGTVALMLQADPTLNVNDVRDILRSTADAPNSVYSDVSWGAGKVNALNAVKEVLKRQSGIGSVMADDESALIVRDLGGRHFNVFVAGEQAISVSLVSMSGATAVSVDAPTNDVTLDASSVTPGVYVLAVSGANSRLTRKIVIR